VWSSRTKCAALLLSIWAAVAVFGGRWRRLGPCHGISRLDLHPLSGLDQLRRQRHQQCSGFAVSDFQRPWSRSYVKGKNYGSKNFHKVGIAITWDEYSFGAFDQFVPEEGPSGVAVDTDPDRIVNRLCHDRLHRLYTARWCSRSGSALSNSLAPDGITCTMVLSLNTWWVTLFWKTRDCQRGGTT
jgi:hypothetical protein